MNTGNKRRKILWMVNIVLISMAMLIPAFANEIQNITTQLKGYTTYEYPYAGQEHILGPENTHYYAIYHNGNGEAQYGEVVRQADDFVVMKVYPDGKTEYFTAPELTEKQKEDFINQYDPIKVQQTMEEKEKEWAKGIAEQYSSLIDKNLIKLSKGENYLLYMYTEPKQEGFAQIKSIFSDVTYGNTTENPYDYNVEKVRDTIVSIIDKQKLEIPLYISLIPYQCEDFPQGTIQYSRLENFENEYGLHILLFNNPTVSMEEQFHIQFEKYLHEVKH